MNTDTLQLKRAVLLGRRDDLFRQTMQNDGAIAVLDELLQCEAQDAILSDLRVEMDRRGSFDGWLCTTRRDAPETLVEGAVHVPVSAFDSEPEPTRCTARFNNTINFRGGAPTGQPVVSTQPAMLPVTRDDMEQDGAGRGSPL